MLTPEFVNHPQFKEFIRAANYFTKTKIEAHEEAKEAFKEIMPLLRGLTKEETEVFIHKLKSLARKNGKDFEYNLLNNEVFQFDEIELSKTSEESNYLNKNRYRLQKKYLDWADKRRMPIDASKAKEVLQNKGLYKS